MKVLKSLIISGREVMPLVEGGKGISISNGESSGAWAASGGVGTFSGVNADSLDDRGQQKAQIYHGTTRRVRRQIGTWRPSDIGVALRVGLPSFKRMVEPEVRIDRPAKVEHGKHAERCHKHPATRTEQMAGDGCQLAPLTAFPMATQ